MEVWQKHGESVLEGVVWGLVQEGVADEECGDCETVGFYAYLIRGPIIGPEEDGEDVPEGLMFREVRTLLTCAGAIARTNSQGFRTVDFYATEARLEQEWSGWVLDAEGDEDEEEDDPEDMKDNADEGENHPLVDGVPVD